MQLPSRLILGHEEKNRHCPIPRRIAIAGGVGFRGRAYIEQRPLRLMDSQSFPFPFGGKPISNSREAQSIEQGIGKNAIPRRL